MRFCTRPPVGLLGELAGEQLIQLIGGEPSELAADSRLLQKTDFQILRRNARTAVARSLERRATELDRLPEGQAGLMPALQEAAELVGESTDHAEVLVVRDAAVELDAIDRVVLVTGEFRIADLRHDHLDLERLQLAREDVTHRLRVGIGERARAHVVAAVRVALHVGIAHADLPELIELAELADARERDAVVDLADLRERGRVLRHQEDAVAILERDAGFAPADALAGVLGLVLHDLLGGDVERNAHAPAPRWSVRLLARDDTLRR